MEKIEGFSFCWRVGVLFLSPFFLPFFLFFPPFLLSFLSFLSFKMSTTFLPSLLPMLSVLSVIEESPPKSLSDEIYERILAGDPWGDLQYEYFPEGLPQEEPKPFIPWTVEQEALYKYVVPDLSLRKAIWETFPVNVQPIRERFEDGAERYSIVWNEERAEYLKNYPIADMCMDHYEDFDTWQTIRLFHALEAHTRKYRVEPARHEGEMCVIAMVFTPKEEASTATATATATAIATVSPPPVVSATSPKALATLRNFPVSWKREGSAHFIEVHRGKMMASFPTTFRSMPNWKQNEMVGAYMADLKRSLLLALASCGDCTVSPSSSAESLCIVHIR
jgi:hypothetical protein